MPDVTQPPASNDGLHEAACAVHDPWSGRTLGALRAVRKAQIDPHGRVQVTLALPYPLRSGADALRAAVQAAVQAWAEAAGASVASVAVDLQPQVHAHAAQRGLRPLPGAKNVLAVASGKGGVGKSTVAVNLALALLAEGAAVGLLDADIYGPSQPLMTGASGPPESLDGKTMEPKRALGLQVNSIGFLVDPDQATIWRGPMASGALEQLIHQTHWQDLDYLVVDMPPGTGDIALTLAQKVPLTGAVIVTTPQDIALADARKGIHMFGKVGVPILGIVENMALYCCPSCGHTEAIFGTGGGERMAAELGVDFLGALPLARSIREQADSGRPTVAADPDGEHARMYRDIALRVAARVALQARDFSHKMPTITVSRET